MTHDATLPNADSTPTAVDPDSETFVYNEFSMFPENCAEVAIPFPADIMVNRIGFQLPEIANFNRSISAIRWGTGPIDIVFVHGAAQNAHTWDTTVLALHGFGFRNMLCIDLPGHGKSEWRSDHHYEPKSMADDVAAFIADVAPDAKAIVGMSLGGMTTLALADANPGLVRKLAMVDVTPGVNALKAKAVTDFVRGPQSFDSFNALLARTKEHNPTRSESSLRRGILHNAHRNADGSWSWNYDRGLSEITGPKVPDAPDAPDAPRDSTAGDSTAGDSTVGGSTAQNLIERFNPMWDIYERLTMPLLVLRGALSPIVDDNDIAEVLKRRPEAKVIVVENAGHSIQGDQPVVLAGHIASFVKD